MTRLFMQGLTVIDCGLLDPSQGLMGKTWLVDLELAGPLNDHGMVVDFGVIKPALRKICKDTVDHRLIVPEVCEGLSLQQEQGQLLLRYQYGQSQNLQYQSPEESVFRLATSHTNQHGLITESAITALLESAIQKKLAGIEDIRLDALSISLRDAHADLPNAYRYTHGLSKHDGACQRIGHGHTARVEVAINGIRATAQENALAHRINNRHIVCARDIQKRCDGQLEAGYQARAGHYQLTLPEERFFVVEGDGTVENIAEQLADLCKQDHPQDEIRISAWEGADKGAIAERP